MEAILLFAALALASGETPTREQVEADLAVRVSWPEGVPRHRWWRVAPRIEIVNRSETTGHRIIQSGPQSDLGRHDPYLHLTMEREAESGVWIDVAPPRSEHCLLGPVDWLSDVVDLAPGKSIDLVVPHVPSRSFEDDHAHRIRAHYEFRRRPVDLRGIGRATGDPSREPAGLGRMEDRPVFHLVSEPSEVRFDPDDATQEEITRFLRLRVELDGSPTRWKDLRVSVVLENLSAERSFLYVARDPSTEDVAWDGARNGIEPLLLLRVNQLEPDGRWLPIPLRSSPRPVPVERDWRRRIARIEPGGTIRLSSGRELAPRIQERAATNRVRIHASYAYLATPYRENGTVPWRFPDCLGSMAAVPPFSLRSEWIEVELLP